MDGHTDGPRHGPTNGRIHKYTPLKIQLLKLQQNKRSVRVEKRLHLILVVSLDSIGACLFLRPSVCLTPWNPFSWRTE